jgi:pimeloyl-ACP methyl ester carboxylesterase
MEKNCRTDQAVKINNAKKILSGIGISLGCLVLLGIIIPLIWPIPSLTGIQPIDQLMDADSLFIDLDGIRVHYKQYGNHEPYIILLHGFGASTFSWREVMEPLSHYGTVIAYDRPGFGLSDRPWKMDWNGMNPYGVEGEVQLLMRLMEAKGIQSAVLIGHSAGGTIATYAAWKYAERVQALVEVDAAIYERSHAISSWLNWILYTPQAERIGPLFMRSIQKWGVDFLISSWFDPSKITEEVMRGYKEALQAPDWDRGLFELLRAPQPQSIVPYLRFIQMPSLVISGQEDKIVPLQNSMQLAKELVNSQLISIPDCGHLPQEEQPQIFLETIIPFLQQVYP